VEDISTAIETFRSSLPVFLDRWDSEETAEEEGIGDESDEIEHIRDHSGGVGGYDDADRVDALERLVHFHQLLLLNAVLTGIVTR
jgi:hypothetical protein